jgi:general secretion pathway protein E
MSTCTTIIAQADAVYLASWFKPLVFVLVLIGWGWAVSNIDKDSAFYRLPRAWINAAQMGCGIVGFCLMLLIPIFLLGLTIALMVLIGGTGAYAYYRNTKVPAESRWRLSLDLLNQKLGQRQHAQAQKQAAIILLAQDESALAVPSGDDPRAAAHATLENVLDFAVPRGAAQIDLAVDAKQATLVVRIDGVKYPQPSLETAEALALIDYLKGIAELDLEDRRKKQTGVFKFDAGELGRHSIALNTAGSTRGVTMTMALDTAERVQMGLEHMGLLTRQKQQIQDIIKQENKVVIASSPPRQGMTTTIYGLLQEHDPYTSSIVTLEDEQVFEIEGVSHNLLPDDISTTQINEKLSAMLRSDPQVFMLSRLPDPSTATIIARGSSEVRFYFGLRADDAFKTLRIWIKAVGDRKLAAHSIGGIISQRLLRKLCPTCKSPYTPDKAALKKLNLPIDRVDKFYHASGQVMVKDKPQSCPLCHGMGYRGRIAVCEVMPIDGQARQLIAAGEMDRLRTHLRKQTMLWLQEAALARVVEGVTDIKEVSRSLGEGTAAKK